MRRGNCWPRCRPERTEVPADRAWRVHSSKRDQVLTPQRVRPEIAEACPPEARPPRSMPAKPSCAISRPTSTLARRWSPEKKTTRLPSACLGSASTSGASVLKALTSWAPGESSLTISLEVLPPRSATSDRAESDSSRRSGCGSPNRRSAPTSRPARSRAPRERRCPPRRPAEGLRRSPCFADQPTGVDTDPPGPPLPITVATPTLPKARANA